MTNFSKPRVTVLLPVYNGENFLANAIESILNQTFTDFELIIIDDGSTDSSKIIASSFDDTRIRIEENNSNIGLIATLNKGLKLARGDYIARMDADDLSFPDRLKKQVFFMDSHPEVGISGSYIEKVDERGSKVIELPLHHNTICFYMMFDNPFAHNTIVFRRSMVEQNCLSYDQNFKYSEDYDLWDRCSQITVLANIPEPLVRYNYHLLNTSNRYRVDQGKMAANIRHRTLTRLDPSITDDQVRLHNKIFNFEKIEAPVTLEMVRSWLERIVSLGCTTYGINERSAWPLISRFWYGVCGRHADAGFHMWRIFMSSPAGIHAGFNWKLKLLLRCILRRPIVSST